MLLWMPPGAKPVWLLPNLHQSRGCGVLHEWCHTPRAHGGISSFWHIPVSSPWVVTSWGDPPVVSVALQSGDTSYPRAAFSLVGPGGAEQ